ncbi:MAG: penicillin-binding protein 1A [Alphaproteobacteria bacterium]|nr:penicillin-binding protein 1A [Alphaproteobacteria bacterium]
MRVVRFLSVAIAALALLAVAGATAALVVFHQYGRGLPDYGQLADYEPPTVTRLHAGDGRLIAEFAREKRVFVPVEAIPLRVVQAFLAAEDKNFFTHPGVDALGVVRAAVTNIIHMRDSSRRPAGASTITQQVAKNFLLSNEVSFRRKIKEAILTFRIERALSKERILELYLNEIYLGYGSYGVAAAALNYFGRSLDELSLAEAAYLAALPKAPSNYHPTQHRAAAEARRNWVIARMAEEGFASPTEAAAAQAEPLAVRAPTDPEIVAADYFTEEVRRELLDRYGERGLYEGGLSVRTTLDTHLQAIAERALRRGLTAYDRRHGYRGALARLDLAADWPARLAAAAVAPGHPDWRAALVLTVEAAQARIGFADGTEGHIVFDELKWAWRQLAGGGLGPTPRRPADVLAAGDVVAVSPAEQGGYRLEQRPAIEGAVVALDPHTGRVLALVGGFLFEHSQFNRAVQGRRQPGSAFKPFVYAAALESGFTPASLVLDAPFVIDQGPGLAKWKPANYQRKYFGPSTLRLGLEKSRNLMTVRLAQFVGIERIAEVAERFGVVEGMPPQLAMALGAGETTLIRLTAAYAILVNGGKRIVPSLIDRVQDRRGRTVFRHDARDCPGCAAASWRGQAEPVLPDGRSRVIDAPTAYQLVSMLQGVVERGTGHIIADVGRPLAGKTGTTNDSRDAWFVGFAPDLAVGVFCGFDQPRTLGRGETGASVAAPVFRDFMAEALADQPALPFRIPSGVRLVRVNAETGRLARPGERNVILEAFKPGTEPGDQAAPVLDGVPQAGVGGAAADEGTGGLY